MPELRFKGKVHVENHHLVVPFHELVPVKSKGIAKTPSLHDNLLLHGDNLLALKSLLPTYAGKIKCIYIDPPYNTGNEGWAYNDNVNSPMMQHWLGKTIDRDDLTRHDKWCCMMLPRLKLLRELLADDGAIFISIDDNEVHHLRCLLDEVFGEENFVANVIWQKVFAPKNTARHFSEDHDYIVAVSRDAEKWTPNLLKRSQESLDRYKNPDNDPRGAWASSDLTARNYYSKGTYEVTSPAGKKFSPSVGNYFRISPEKFKAYDEAGRIWWGANKNSMPRLKRYLEDVKKGVVPQTLLLHSEVGHTQEAKKELVETVNFERSEDVFNTVKPTRLLQRILQIATDKDSLVLDSFAGSGTTGHAVLKQNAEDGGTRRFVLIECEDYADKVTAERLRRCIKGVKGAKDPQLAKGYGGSFSYFKLGKALRVESLLSGKDLPDFAALAAYLFFTATGEEFNPKKIRKRSGFIGSSRHHDVFLLYTPDLDKLKDLALTLDIARKLPKPTAKSRRRLVFAPTRFLDDHFLHQLQIDFSQLPYEIYETIERTS